MGDQFKYINNLNRPNLVDNTLLQKINDIYQSKPITVQNQIPNYVQRAGSAIYSLMLDNLFISILILVLVLFLGWCYVEKQRHDAIQEKYLQKLYVKLLLTNKLEEDKPEPEYFLKEPELVNIEQLFNEINNDIENIKINSPINQENIQQNTKENIKFYNPVSKTPEKNKMISGISGVSSSKYMDVGVYTKDSYMLL